MRGQLRTCPECGSRNVRRTHSKGLFEHTVLSVLWLRPFRCDDCADRFIHKYSAHIGTQVHEKVIAENLETPTSGQPKKSRLFHSITFKAKRGHGPDLALDRELYLQTLRPRWSLKYSYLGNFEYPLTSGRLPSHLGTGAMLSSLRILPVEK